VDTTTDFEKKANSFFAKARLVCYGLLIGFSAGLYVSSAMSTKQLMEDCETMKQFRIGKLAYDCKVK
jgi:hypothetical protein